MWKKLCTWGVALCVIVSLLPLPIVQAVGTVTEVSSWEEIEAALSGAESDITLDLKNDITISESTTFPTVLHHVTITSSNGSRLILSARLTISDASADITLRDITITEAGSSGYIYLAGAGAKLEVDGVQSLKGDDTARYFIYLNNAGASLTICSMTAEALATASAVGVLYLSKGSLTFSPTGTIEIPTIVQYKTFTNGFQIVPQEGYNITSATFNEQDITEALSNGTYDVPGASATTKYEGLSITVEAAGGGNSGSSETKALTESNFTQPSEGYFTTAGIKVTPSTDDLSFTVACDNACVVAKDNGDGTYTRLTGTAVEGAENTYSFTAASADDKIVVALKGDVSGDGELGTADVTQANAANLGKKTLSALQLLLVDVSGDGELGTADVTQLNAANLGKKTISW